MTVFNISNEYDALPGLAKIRSRFYNASDLDELPQAMETGTDNEAILALKADMGDQLTSVMLEATRLPMLVRQSVSRYLIFPMKMNSVNLDSFY